MYFMYSIFKEKVLSEQCTKSKKVLVRSRYLFKAMMFIFNFFFLMQNGVILCRLEFISSTICNRLCRYIVLIIVLCYGSYKNREDTIKNTLACIMFLKSKIYIAFFFFLLLEHRDWETTTFKWTITHKHIPVSHLSSITYLVTKVYHSNGHPNVTDLSNVYSMT